VKKKRIEDVIIVGSGPAGMSCAIQLKRCGIIPLILDQDNKGGLLRYANLVENYPGFPGGIKGKDLVKRFSEQFKLEKLKCIQQKVLNVKYNRNLFEVNTVGNNYTSNFLVIATGTKPKLFKNLYIDPSLSDSISYGISGLQNKRKKRFVIIGAGDLAFDYGLNLGKNNEVTILNHSEVPKCIPLLYNRAKRMKSFTYYENTILNQVAGSGKDKLSIKYKSASGDSSLIADYLIFAIGRTADPELIDNEFKKKIKLLRKSGRLYFIGDAANSHYRQTAIAAGDGIKAAMQVYEKLRSFK
jgi:thioredoxin reductase (NADPH)